MNDINRQEVLISDTNLEEFKRLVRRAVFLKHEEEALFKAIPNHTWRSIFAKNFDGNFEYARRLLLYKYRDIEKIDTVAVDREKNKIFNLEKATQFITSAIDKKSPIVFITDFDNDGSLAQAVINEYLEIDKEAAQNMMVEYAQTVNGNANRGFTVDHVDLIVESKGIDPEDEFLIITADNGINSREEQAKILDKYPKAKIVVTDHHNPDPEMVVEDSGRTVIFNPHYKPTEFYKKFNISGATTVGVLLKNVLSKRFIELELANYSKNFEKLGTLFKVANLLDYVESHPADKPEKDYIITKFLQLQPLMNINNSISKIITGEIPTDVISSLKEKIPQLNMDLIYEEAKNIHTQNTVAKILLNIYKNRDNYKPMDVSVKVKKKKTKKGDEVVESTEATVQEEVVEQPRDLSKDDFYKVFLDEIKNDKNYTDHSNINPNFIEQLRPIIFGLAADYNKTAFLDKVQEKMIEVFESIKLSEKRMIQELRQGEVITKKRLENSCIMYADPNVLKIFNRKFLNKVYNDENPGFTLTLDNVKPEKVSGSFRSLYNISDILRDKAKLEKKLGVKIETPGHEKAAGFIIKSKTKPVTEETIEQINQFINKSIQNIKENEIKATTDYLLTDLNAIKLIDRINTVVRGNVSNFEKVTPVLQIGPNTIWTDAYTTEQFSMEDLVNKRKYGYITINTDFDGGTIIIPVELIRRIVESNYKDYISLGYMDGGVFMAERVVSAEQATNIIDLRSGNSKTKALVEAWEKDFKDKNSVELTREQIADNPFFKYHDYGKLNFELFEKMVIGIIDSNKIDTLAVFDVEANGFGNSKLMNIGSTNYIIDPDTGTQMSASEFYDRLYRTSRKEDYLLNDDQIDDLIEITNEEANDSPMSVKKVMLLKHDPEFGVRYFIPRNAENLSKKKRLPFENVKNYVENEDGTVTYNRSIKATMLAYLVKDKDFKVPQEMINLTGIDQEILNKYGKTTSQVDKELAEFYKGKKVLFGAHNTPYDARVARANLPHFYEVLKENKIYDSALFAKEEKLAYDTVTVSKIEQIDKIRENVLFYNNEFSDFNLTKFIEEDKNGYYPDRNNNYLLEIDNGEYYLVDKIQHEKVKIDATKDELLAQIFPVGIPNNSTKYSVEKLAEQWMIHALLLNDEEFNIKLVDLNQEKYSQLQPYAEAIKYFQENYHFDISIEKNITNFRSRYLENVISDEMMDGHFSAEISELIDLTREFLQLNKDIAQKFSDAWMYKMVLEIKDPSRIEVTNDLIDLVNYQTAIPKEKIRQIFDEAINFKTKYNIDHIIQHEMHANGPWRGDVKGDIAFEDKLTLCLLANKEYNPYSHDIKDALDTFNRFQIKAKMIFDIADGLSDSIAQDSYSFRQGIRYDREEITPMIQKIQEKENQLSQKGRQVLKYKLDNDVLPPKTGIYAIVKENVQMTRELIEDHKIKFSFIMLNEQLSSSWQNAPHVRDTLEEVYESNKAKILEYKEELAKYYDFVEYNKKDYHIKEFLDKAIEIGIEGKRPKREPKTDVLILPTTDMESIKNIQKIIRNMYTAASELRSIEPENVAIVKDKIDMRVSAQIETALERALDNPNTEIKDFENTTEQNFLFDVDIVRKTPLERLMDKHQDYRVLNGIVESYQEFSLSNQRKSKNRL